MAAFEQPMAGLLFQPQDFLADSRLGGIEPAGRSGETAAIGHRREGFQQIQIERLSIHIFT
ncbi:hypothetical protein D3C87_1863640 [compost metagenome]